MGMVWKGETDNYPRKSLSAIPHICSVLYCCHDVHLFIFQLYIDVVQKAVIASLIPWSAFNQTLRLDVWHLHKTWQLCKGWITVWFTLICPNWRRIDGCHGEALMSHSLALALPQIPCKLPVFLHPIAVVLIDDWMPVSGVSLLTGFVSSYWNLISFLFETSSRWSTSGHSGQVSTALHRHWLFVGIDTTAANHWQDYVHDDIPTRTTSIGHKCRSRYFARVKHDA